MKSINVKDEKQISFLGSIGSTNVSLGTAHLASMREPAASIASERISTATVAVNLSKLTRFEMDSHLKGLVLKERELLSEILNCLKEIDRRKLYVDMGFASLFQYLTEGIGYSAGSAQRRIDAARLLSEIGSVNRTEEALLADQIKSGAVNLSQISMVQKASREAKKLALVQKTSAQNVWVQLKTKAIHQIKDKSLSEAQKEVASLFEVPVKKESKANTQSDGSVRREVTFSKEQEEKIKLAQELLSHSLPDQDFAGFVEFLCDKVIKQKLMVRRVKSNTVPNARKMNETSSKSENTAIVAVQDRSRDRSQSAEVSESSTATVAVAGILDSSPARPLKPASKSARAIPQPIRKSILQSQKCCQYKDPVTGKICGSRWHLQVDHIQPRWASGSNHPQNLQLLCGQHNRWRYLMQVGGRRL